MKKTTYIRCPRCELNFIQKKDKLCSVCIAEMSANREDNFDDMDLELCPVCKTNYIQSDEVMCATCLKERSGEDEEEVLPDDEWESYVKRDEEEYISPDEETGDLAIVDLDDEEEILDEDLDVISGEFDEEEEEEEAGTSHDEEPDFDEDFDDEVLGDDSEDDEDF